MKILVLNESIWRCGDDSKDPSKSRGTGYTKLLNEEGYMCCLGQFSLQLSPELKRADLLHRHFPQNLEIAVEDLTAKAYGELKDTELSKKAVAINDNSHSTISEKVKELTELFAKYEYKIIFISMPFYKKIWNWIKFKFKK